MVSAKCSEHVSTGMHVLKIIVNLFPGRYYITPAELLRFLNNRPSILEFSHHFHQSQKISEYFSLPHLHNFSSTICSYTTAANMASEQSTWDATKDTVGQKTEETKGGAQDLGNKAKDFGAEKTGQTESTAASTGDAAKAKAGDAKATTEGKFEETKKGTADNTAASKSKVEETGDKLKSGFADAKAKVTGH